MRVVVILVSICCCRDYKVKVSDRRFEPMILLIEQGDKVWFSWDKARDSHCVFQIEQPAVDLPAAEQYKQVLANSLFKVI